MANQPTPKLTQAQIEERIAATAAKRPKIEKVNNAQLLAESGLRVVHIHPSRSYTGHGMTVAFRPPHQHSKRVVEIATSLCNPGDVFCRKLGTRTAIESFQKGRTVFIPTLPGSRSPIPTIQALFTDPAAMAVDLEDRAVASLASRISAQIAKGVDIVDSE